ncbi:MAG: pectin esterase [Oscillospiraceae bacterium]|nr:pectin esterase [Oscillospiraceae bacterium]
MREYLVRPGDDVQAVLDRAEPGSRICFEAGVYRQKLMLRTPGLRLEGEGAENTVLLWGDYAKKLDSQGREYNTFRTWTLAVCADDVEMRNLSVLNDALDPVIKGQEVALSVYGDRFSMTDCMLRSTQDTLFLGPLPPDLIERYDGFLPDELRVDRLLSQSFRRCRIEGSVDFIFGCGAALFEDCEIVSVFDGRDHGYMAAPAHSLSQAEGFTFRRCDFTREEGVADGTIFLARPWRDYGLCRFEDCRYGRHIRAEGFDPWRDSGRDKTARFFEAPAVPGRVSWCNRQTEA